MRDYESFFGKELEGTWWTIIDFGPDIFLGARQHKNKTLQCRCRCGTERNVPVGNLFPTPRSKSCGCMQDRAADRRTHGLEGTPTYWAYHNARRRCEESKHQMYPRYGGRGIKFLFASIEEMVAEIGQKPKGMMLDRIDNNGHYCKGNIRWATPEESARNKNSNRILMHDGQSLLICEWAEKLGIPASAISKRLSRGWTVSEALTTPLFDGT